LTFWMNLLSLFLWEGVLKNDNHKPRHTASHSKDYIFMYFDVSSCKVNVIHEVEAVRSLCYHLLRENRKEHSYLFVVYMREKAPCFMSYSA